ncbi:MAG: hypothetical protein ACLS4Z_09135 [Christensenellaceae bacterium]
MEKKFRLLKAEEIEVKVKQATEKGAVALIYKTSRVDMDILDETVGAENWADDYKEIHGNLYCGIGLKSSPEQPFVWKWDCGIESREDAATRRRAGVGRVQARGRQVGIGRSFTPRRLYFLTFPQRTGPGIG